MERRLKHDLASCWTNQGASEKEIEELYTGAIARIYANATGLYNLNIVLSNQLPDYTASGSGGVSGGGASGGGGQVW